MTRFNTRPLLTSFAEALSLVAMAGLTAAGAAAFADAPTAHTSVVHKLPTVVVTGKATPVLHEQLPTIIVTGKRAG